MGWVELRHKNKLDEITENKERSEVTEILEFDLRKVPLITENYELDKKIMKIKDMMKFLKISEGT